MVVVLSLLFSWPFAAYAVGVLLVTTVLLNYSMVFGLDGSDQMLLVVLAGLMVSEIGLHLDSHVLVLAGVAFVAIQCALSYFTAGVAKLFGRLWRSGMAIPAIIQTQSYGDPKIGRLFDGHAWVGKTGTYLVLTLQCRFAAGRSAVK